MHSTPGRAHGKFGVCSGAAQCLHQLLLFPPGKASRLEARRQVLLVHSDVSEPLNWRPKPLFFRPKLRRNLDLGPIQRAGSPQHPSAHIRPQPQRESARRSWQEACGLGGPVERMGQCWRAMPREARGSAGERGAVRLPPIEGAAAACAAQPRPEAGKREPGSVSPQRAGFLWRRKNIGKESSHVCFGLSSVCLPIKSGRRGDSFAVFTV